MFRNSALDKDKRYRLSRRKVLRGAAVMLTVLMTRVRGVFASEIANAGNDPGLRQTLTKLVFHLFPHDGLAEIHYQEVADHLLSRASTDSVVAKLLRTGADYLDEGNPSSWIEQSEAEQTARIKRFQGGDFFRLVRNTAIEHLYRNKAVWELIGYEGSSVEFGGYIDRGFDDIDWLPGKNERR